MPVAQALDSSYPLAEREEWWKYFSDTHTKFYKRSQRTIWLKDANATVGPRQSSAICSMNAEQESANGEWFHNVLFRFDMALPVTFQLNSAVAGTWCSTAGHWKRYDFVAISRAWLPSVQTAGGEP